VCAGQTSGHVFVLSARLERHHAHITLVISH